MLNGQPSPPDRARFTQPAAPLWWEDGVVASARRRTGFPTGGSVDSSDLRRHNLSLILEHVAANGPCGRVDIAAGTGLVRTSLTSLVADLLEVDLLRRMGQDHSRAGRGRPRALLELGGTEIGILAVQLGVDGIDLVAFDLSGAMLLESSIVHDRPFSDPIELADLAGELVRDALAQLAARGVTVFRLAVVVAAPVSDDRIPVALDFGWKDVDILGLLADRLPSFPAGMRLYNDANAAAVAEQAALAEASGRPVDDLVYLKANTGIGGAVISGGRLIAGSHGVGSEPGHLVVQRGGELCECGRNGCLVTVAGPDLVLAAAGLVEVRERVGMRAALFELVALVRAGDAHATAAVDDAGRWLGIAVADLVIMFDPEVIVLGGYWGDVRDALVASFTAETENLLAIASGSGDRVVPVLSGALGVRASLTGAIRQSRTDLLGDPVWLIAALKERRPLAAG